MKEPFASNGSRPPSLCLLPQTVLTIWRVRSLRFVAFHEIEPEQFRGPSLTCSENFDRSVGHFDQPVVRCQQPQSAAAAQGSGPHATMVRRGLGRKWNAVLRTGVKQRPLGWTREHPQL